MHNIEMHRTNLHDIDQATLLYKDAVLDRLSEVANVAQFVSFAPDLSQRYARVHGFAANHNFASAEAAISSLLKASPDGSVNVRSFTPENPKSREFIYGLRHVGQVLMEVERLASADLYTIVNETVDVRDGGVSGVTIGNVIEFAPGDTPRCVEKPGTVSMPRDFGLKLLEKVYHFHPSLNYEPGMRIEFSLHPLRRGFRLEHTIIWEMEDVGGISFTPEIRWPNLFSRFIGDKAFGLLIADAIGLPVPNTIVISRTIAPFTLGSQTGTGEMWIRTCPIEQDPGRYTTQRGWLDPFKLMNSEDPNQEAIISVLAQEGVEAFYSGSLVSTADEKLTIEGVRGHGDEFMLGRAGKEQLPADIVGAVRQLYEKAQTQLGPVRLEWVHDGRRAWVVQLHRGATLTSGNMIYPGTVNTYRRFDVTEGIESLRSLILDVQDTGDGIILVGNVGVTSHLGDLLRRAKIPSLLELPEKT